MSKVRPVDVSSRPGTASTLARLSLSRSESGKSLGKLHITPKRSKFFIMDADGHYVDTERGRRWGVLSRFSSAKLEHDFKRYEEGVWRSGYELQFSLVCMLALSGCGLVNAASLHPSSWATTRIVTASLSILLCISVLVMSRWMKLLGILTVQAVIALLTVRLFRKALAFLLCEPKLSQVLSCMSSSHSYSFVSTSLVVLANVRAPCAELLPTALFAVTVAGCVAFQALDKGMDPVARTLLVAYYDFCLMAARAGLIAGVYPCLQSKQPPWLYWSSSLWPQSLSESHKAHHFARRIPSTIWHFPCRSAPPYPGLLLCRLCISRGKRQSLALESSRRKASTGSRDQDHGRRSVASNQTNYADGPIQTVLEELRVVAESNPSLASLINELSQVIS